MVLGFTGTRDGLTAQQWAAVDDLLTVLNVAELTGLRHGGCRGADAAMHRRFGELVRPGGRLVHPGPYGYDAAIEIGPMDAALPCAPFLHRNEAIVDKCDILIACPKTKREEQRSGTWATVRYARLIGRSTLMIWP